MSTRNLTIVILDKKVKVAQYGQYDGYPSGLGLGLINKLKTLNIEKFKEQVRKVEFITDTEFDALDEDTWLDIYPQFSNSVKGYEVMDYIMDNDNLKLMNQYAFAGDGLFCEWVYVIDLDKNRLETFEGFNQKPVGVRSRFADLNNTGNGGYQPPKKVHQIQIDEVIQLDYDTLKIYGDENFRDFRKVVKLTKFLDEKVM